MLRADDRQEESHVRFDDRLTTVLAQPAEDAHDRAVRWRQLVELLARARAELNSPIARQALDEVRDVAPLVDEQVRAAAARAVAGLQLPFALIEIFAADRLTVSAPVLAAARLDDAEWSALHSAASDDVKGFIASLHPEAALAATREVEPEPEPAVARPVAAPPSEDKSIPSISELVARIERLRRTRDSTPPPVEPPLADSAAGPAGAAMFRWEAGPSGEIRWVQGVPRGALVGRSLVNAADEGFDERVGRAFAVRAPFRDAALSLSSEGPLAGEWRVSGVPAFLPADGRFAGYRGVAVRQRETGKASAAKPEPALPDHDSLRELVHEIKTPLNAIIGFAEIIERQYLGPADHHYRERASEIVGNARTLLDAIDDLDFAAKLQSGRADPGVAADLATLLTTLEAELQERAGARSARIRLEIAAGAACRTNAALAARLVRRFATTLVDTLEPGERLTFQTAEREGQCLVLADRPKRFASVDTVSLLDSTADTGALGNAAFWLRLVRGLARIAGGDLSADESQFTLILPQAAG